MSSVFVWIVWIGGVVNQIFGAVTCRHNFYVFPRQEIGGDASSYEFLCQTSSLEFLAKYQFDFNTCINEGELLVSQLLSSSLVFVNEWNLYGSNV